MNSHDEQHIEAKANKVLDESLNNLSPETQARLSESRKHALMMAGKPSFWQAFIKPIPIASALAFSFALIIALPQWQSSSSHHLNDRNSLAIHEEFDDFLLLTEVDDETLEIIEDLEFALWLSEEVELPNEDSEFEEQAHNHSIQNTSKGQKTRLAETRLKLQRKVKFPAISRPSHA